MILTRCYLLLMCLLTQDVARQIYFLANDSCCWRMGVGNPTNQFSWHISGPEAQIVHHSFLLGPSPLGDACYFRFVKFELWVWGLLMCFFFLCKLLWDKQISLVNTHKMNLACAYVSNATFSVTKLSFGKFTLIFGMNRGPWHTERSFST